MTPAANPPSLSEDSLKEAFEALDWVHVEAVLTKAGGPAVDSASVGSALQRCNGLLFKYPAASSEKKRAALFTQLEGYLAPVTATDGRANPVRGAIELLELVEAGYRHLVSQLGKTDASKLDAPVHVAAALLLAEREVDRIVSTLHEQLKGQAITPHVQYQVEDGKALDPDAMLEHCVTFAGMTVHMEAFKNKWFDDTGKVVIPLCQAVGEDAIYQAGSTFALAVLWKRWQLTEERARFLGEGMSALPKAEWPADAPTELSKVVLHKGQPTLEILHKVASERLSDKLGQNFFEMMSDANTEGIEAQSASNHHLLPPTAFVSRAELHACWTISDMVAFDILKDNEQPGGLRLVEWIRGYAALDKLVDGTSIEKELVKTRTGWLDFFARYGLASDAAGCLLDRLTFGRSSRDLFDQPFLKRSDGTYRLFKAAFKSINIAQVVMSAIGNLGEQLQKKGKSFEKAVHACFAAAKLKSYAFKEKRNGAEYEYDVVVPWGDYLFVIECKNRSLPQGNPIQQHYFDMETDSNSRQLKRLMKALDDYPDILAKHLPPEALNNRKVACVLNCLPYSIPGAVDGIFFYDFSALGRFFKKGEVAAMSFKKGGGLQHVAGVARLWKGASPTPEDLMTQLEESVQFRTVKDTLELEIAGFPLPPDWWVYTPEYKRRQHPDLVRLSTAAGEVPVTPFTAADDA